MVLIWSAPSAFIVKFGYGGLKFKNNCFGRIALPLVMTFATKIVLLVFTYFQLYNVHNLQQWKYVHGKERHKYEKIGRNLRWFRFIFFKMSGLWSNQKLG